MSLASIIISLASLIGDEAGKKGGRSSGLGQVWGNIGNRDVEGKENQALFNVLDPGGGFSNTLAAFGMPIFKDEEEEESNSVRALMPLMRDKNSFLGYDKDGYLVSNKDYESTYKGGKYA